MSTAHRGRPGDNGPVDAAAAIDPTTLGVLRAAVRALDARGTAPHPGVTALPELVDRLDVIVSRLARFGRVYGSATTDIGFDDVHADPADVPRGTSAHDGDADVPRGTSEQTAPPTESSAFGVTSVAESDEDDRDLSRPALHYVDTAGEAHRVDIGGAVYGVMDRRERAVLRALLRVVDDSAVDADNPLTACLAPEPPTVRASTLALRVT